VVGGDAGVWLHHSDLHDPVTSMPGSSGDRSSGGRPRCAPCRA